MKKILSMLVITFWCASCWGMKGLTEESGDFATKYPLHYAAEKGDIQKVKKELKTHDVNERDFKDNTPLLYARDIDVMRLLLQNKADVNAQNRQGSTALHFAVDEENDPAIDLLLEYKARTDIKDKIGKKDKEGQTVIEMVEEKEDMARRIGLLEEREKRQKYLRGLKARLKKNPEEDQGALKQLESALKALVAKLTALSGMLGMINTK